MGSLAPRLVGVFFYVKVILSLAPWLSQKSKWVFLDPVLLKNCTILIVKYPIFDPWNIIFDGVKSQVLLTFQGQQMGQSILSPRLPPNRPGANSSGLSRYAKALLWPAWLDQAPRSDDNKAQRQKKSVPRKPSLWLSGPGWPAESIPDPACGSGNKW